MIMAEKKESKKVDKKGTEKHSDKALKVSASALESDSKKRLDKGLKDIGIDVSNPPTESCNDSKCPYHGNLKVRGRIFEGIVKSTKMQNSVVIEWDYFVPIKKYQRYMRRKSKIVAHKPGCITVHANQAVRVAECRPLSKTKGFVVIEALPTKHKGGQLA